MESVKPLGFTVTETAARKIREMMDIEGVSDHHLRVAVRPGGCSGFSYEMFFDVENNQDDSRLSFADDLDVVVDRDSLRLLQGATLDYSETLTRSGFSFKHLGAKRTCGCEQSFS